MEKLNKQKQVRSVKKVKNAYIFIIAFIVKCLNSLNEVPSIVMKFSVLGIDLIYVPFDFISWFFLCGKHFPNFFLFHTVSSVCNENSFSKKYVKLKREGIWQLILMQVV
jgi:hypothetical protein